MKSLGVKKLYVGDRPWTKVITNRIGSFARLLESQGFSVNKHEGEKIDFDFSTYRQVGMRYGDTITSRVATWMGVKIDQSKPWLSFEDKNPDAKGKIIVSRCARWHGEYFPWREIVDTFGDDILFIGHKVEHEEFCKEFGSVPRLPTVDLYEAGIAIAACDLFIGNQSSPNAIAEALKRNSIQECCLYAFDCIYPRENKRHVTGGELSFSCCGKSITVAPSYPKHGYKIVFNEREYKAKHKHVAVALARADLFLQGKGNNVAALMELVERY